MSYMNREMRRASRKRCVAAWVLRVEYADGDTELTAFGGESDARIAFRVALDVKVDEPEGIGRVVLLDPAGVEVSSSDAEVSP